MLREVWRLIRQGQVRLARKWQAKLHTKDTAARRLFLEDFRGDGVRLGRAETRRGWGWISLPEGRLLSQHILTTGATGMGKSRLIAAVLFQLLQRRVPIVLLDMKSELSDIVLEHLLPAAPVTPIRLIRPFSQAVPLLRLTEPEIGVSREIQALNLAASLAEAVGADLGVRMHRAFLRTSTLAIEKNLPLPIIAEWVSNPVRFVRDARTSQDPQVVRYATHEFPRENRASLDALRARLDELFHLREIRLALSAPSCLSFAETLESGVTIFDFGSPPAGAEGASRFIGGPVLGRLTRTILSRHNPQQPVLVVLEEFQELLGRHQIEQFKRLLSLSRFKQACLWFSNQQPAQIADVDPMLLRILRTNTGLEMIFRASIEDANKLSQGLSTRRTYESISAARARFTEDIASLPRREFYLWNKGATYGPQRIRSPRLELDLEVLEKIDPWGTVSVPADKVREVVPECEDEVLKPKGRFG